MRRFTLAALCGAYICLSLIVAVSIASNSTLGAGMAAFIGSLGLAFAFHGLISAAVNTVRLSGELGNIREAHLIFARQLEKIDQRLGEVVDTVTADALRRSEELTSEVHSLEDAVHAIVAPVMPGARVPNKVWNV